jgi:hypothetical protein
MQISGAGSRSSAAIRTRCPLLKWFLQEQQRTWKPALRNIAEACENGVSGRRGVRRTRQSVRRTQPRRFAASAGHYRALRARLIDARQRHIDLMADVGLRSRPAPGLAQKMWEIPQSPGFTPCPGRIPEFRDPVSRDKKDDKCWDSEARGTRVSMAFHNSSMPFRNWKMVALARRQCCYRTRLSL